MANYATLPPADRAAAICFLLRFPHRVRSSASVAVELSELVPHCTGPVLATIWASCVTIMGADLKDMARLSSLIAQLVPRSLAQLSTLTPPEIAIMLNAIARLELTDRGGGLVGLVGGASRELELIEALVARARSLWDSFPSDYITIVLRATKQLAIGHSELLMALGTNHAFIQPELRKLQPAAILSYLEARQYAVSSCLLASAFVQYSYAQIPDPRSKRLLDAVQEGVDSLDARSLECIWQGCVSSTYKPSNSLLVSLAKATLKKIRMFSPRGLAKVLNTMRKLDFTHTTLDAALAQCMDKITPQSLPDSNPSVRGK